MSFVINTLSGERILQPIIYPFAGGIGRFIITFLLLAVLIASGYIATAITEMGVYISVLLSSGYFVAVMRNVVNGNEKIPLPINWITYAVDAIRFYAALFIYAIPIFAFIFVSFGTANIGTVDTSSLNIVGWILVGFTAIISICYQYCMPAVTARLAEKQSVKSIFDFPELMVIWFSGEYLASFFRLAAATMILFVPFSIVMITTLGIGSSLIAIYFGFVMAYTWADAYRRINTNSASAGIDTNTAVASTNN